MDYKKKKPICEKNKKEIIEKLIDNTYFKGERLILAIGVNDISIFVLGIKHLEVFSKEQLNVILSDYIIAYRFC